MAKPITRAQLKEYSLRKLGAPVINIEIDDTQIEDRIDDALQKFSEGHYDATSEEWVAYKLTQTDLDNEYVTLPEDILVVLEVMPVNDIVAHNNMFSYQYQAGLQQLSNFKPFDSLDYYMRMTHYEEVKQMLSAAQSFEFNRHENKLTIRSIDFNTLGLDFQLGIKVHRIIDPELFGSVYNDTWLKAYTTALIKHQWGANVKKFSGVSLLGGVEINGQQIFDEAKEEIETLETELWEKYAEPIDFIMG